jgi:hypothetical protein
MNDQIQNQLQQRIELFAADVTAILQRAVADSVAQVMKSTPGARAAAPASKPAKAGRVTEADELLREIKRAGGRRIEELAKALRVPSKSLKAPMKKLLEGNKVKTTGQARGTKYRAS